MQLWSFRVLQSLESQLVCMYVCVCLCVMWCSGVGKGVGGRGGGGEKSNSSCYAVSNTFVAHEIHVRSSHMELPITTFGNIDIQDLTQVVAL